MEEVEGDWMKVWGRAGIGIPPMVLGPIAEHHKESTTAKRTAACAEAYVKYDPDASWTNLKAALMSQGEQKAAEKITQTDLV